MSEQGNISISNAVVDRATLESKITAGDFLIIAADEKVLAGLPSGNWIAGTIPYFMTDDGGKVDQEHVYVSTIEGMSPSNPARITLYDINTISRVALEAPEHGFTILMVPAGSEVHASYSQNAPEYERMFFTPIIGWVSGVHLNELSTTSPKVGFGPASGLLSATQAVAMHVPLPESQVPNVKTVNLFKQNTTGPAIRFPEKSFSVSDCIINGKTGNLAEYIKETQIDTRLPLVADYSGISVNVSIQEAGDDNVKLYAPVFPDIEYHFAEPIEDYVSQFNHALPASDSNSISFSCNCILNFLYSELEGKKTGAMTGPMTFGEIAYQTLNQTMVYMTIDKAS